MVSKCRRLRKMFETVNAACARVTLGLRKVGPGGALLLRSAEQLERAHGRLFGLLGMEGERPALRART